MNGLIFCDYINADITPLLISASFAHNNIYLLTGNQPECIDHIAVSKNFASNKKVNISEWNLDKSLSDHKGIVAEICFP